MELAIITGGTSGIGLAAARRLAAHYRLALLYRGDENRAQAAAAELGDRAHCFRIDVGSDEAVEGGYAAILQHFESRGPVALINCAGLGRVMQFFVQSRRLDAAQELMNVNYFGTLRLVQKVLPGMYSRKAGAIVNVSSVAAQGGFRGYIGYAESKAAVECFTRNLAAEVGHRGISVNCVAPGLVETRETEAFVQQARPQSINEPLGRLISTDEVARIIEMLVLGGAALNGEVIRVDGGNSVARRQLTVARRQLEILHPGTD
jgi:3-oxoacyl-[acyl-carrier protein] reductase